MLTAFEYFEVQMRAGSDPGHTDIANDLAALDPISRLDGGSPCADIQVRVTCRKLGVVTDDDGHAVRLLRLTRHREPGLQHRAIGSGEHGGSIIVRQVDAGMEAL